MDTNKLIELDNALTAVADAIRQPIQTGDGEVDETLLAYYDELRELTSEARKREIERLAFVGAMTAVVVRYLRRLFLIGTGTDDIPDETAQSDFDEERRLHEERVPELAEDIYGGRYDENEDDGITDDAAAAMLAARVALWANKAAGIHSLGQLHNPAVIKYIWSLGNTVHHCDDCLRLDGQVHSRAAWLSSGYRPQGSNLECGGWRCDCSYVPARAGAPDVGSF